MSTANRWCSYGEWDKIAGLRRVKDIRKQISGVDVWTPNILPEGVEQLLPRSSTVLDFGCGLGRNQPLLKKKFKTVKAVDIPEMVKRLKRSKKVFSGYDAVFTDLKEALRDTDVFFESVVLQHLVDAKETRKIADAVNASKVKTIVSTWNAAFDSLEGFVEKKTAMMEKFGPDWTITKFADKKSFPGIDHVVYVLTRK